MNEECWNAEARLKKVPETPRLSELMHDTPWALPLTQLTTGTDALDSRLGLPSLDGVFLLGEPGNGRHRLARALMAELGQVDPDVRWLRISGASLALLPGMAALERLEAALALGRKRLIILQAEEWSACRWSGPLYDRLTEELEEREEEAHVFPIVLERRKDAVSPLLWPRLLLCRFHNPDLGARQLWLKERMGCDTAVDGLDFAKLAEETEGMSFSEMEALCRHLLLLHKWNCLAQFSFPEEAEDAQEEETEEEMERRNRVLQRAEKAFQKGRYAPDKGYFIPLLKAMRRELPGTVAPAAAQTAPDPIEQPQDKGLPDSFQTKLDRVKKMNEEEDTFGLIEMLQSGEMSLP